MILSALFIWFITYDVFLFNFISLCLSFKLVDHFNDKQSQTLIYYNLEKNMTHTDPNNTAGMTQAELQTQVVDLQMNLSHLELVVDRLDEVIARQDKDLQTLQRQLKLLYKQVESQDTEAGIAPFDVVADRPPHY